MKETIPLAQFLPDLLDQTFNASVTVFNVVPKSVLNEAVIYEPNENFVFYVESPVSSLPSLGTFEPNYIFSFKSLDSISHTVLCSDSHIVIASSTSWRYGTSATFNLPLESYWDATIYGNYIILVNGADNCQVWETTTTSKFTPITGMPLCKFVRTIRSWVVAAHIDGEPQRVHWSSINDPLDWPTPFSLTAEQNQSGYVDLPGDRGEITALESNIGQTDGLVFFENGIVRMNFTGYPFTWSFEPINGAKGTKSPKSLVKYNQLLYYLGTDGFYVTDGVSVKPIGILSVNRWITEQIDPTKLYRVMGALHPSKPIIYWSFASKNAQINKNDFILCYNVSIDKWSLIKYDHKIIANSLSLSLSLDDLDIYGDIDSLPYSLDSSFWKGGYNMISIITTAAQYYTFGSSALSIQLDSVVVDKGGRITVNEIRPIYTGTSTTLKSILKGRPFEYGNFATISVTAKPQQLTGKHSLYGDSRQIKITIETSGPVNLDELIGIEINYTNSGEF